MNLQDFILKEALDKHFDYQYVEVSNPKVLSQYTFEHNGKTFALRHLLAPEMGSKVVKVQVGTLNGKKFSNKLLGVTDFKMFFSTVANILLDAYHNPKSSKMHQKQLGIALVVPKKEFDKYKRLLSVTTRIKLKKYFFIEEETNEHPLASSFKVMYLVRKGKNFSSVFSTASEALNTDGADSQEDIETQPEPTPEPQVVPEVPTSSHKEETTDKEGLYKTNLGSLLYIQKINGEPDLYTTYKWKNGGVMSTAVEIDSAKINDVLNAVPWETGMWVQEGYGNTPTIYFSLENYEGKIFRFNGFNITSADLKDIFANNAPKFKKCMPSGKETVPYKGDTNFFLSITSGGKLADYAFNADYKPDVFVDMSGDLNFRASQALIDKMNKEGTLPSDAKAMLSSQSHNPLEPNSASSPNYTPGPNPPVVDYDINYKQSKPPKLEDQWDKMDEYIEDLNIRTKSNTPGGVNIGGLLTIDYEDNFEAIYDKFEQIKQLTGSNRGRMSNLISKYMNGRHDNAERFAQQISKQRDKLTSIEQDAVSIYTGSGYKSINNALRGISNPTQSVVSEVKKLDKLFASNGIQLPQGVIVYRGQSNSDEEVVMFEEGKEVEFRAFVSCSLSPTIAANFSKTSLSIGELLNKTTEASSSFNVNDYIERKRVKMVMSISDVHHIPVFVPGKDSNVNGEAEVMFPRGTKLVLDGQLREVHPRVMLGHFKVTGINGMEGILEHAAFKNFKMFCEENDGTERAAKEMVTLMMMSDYVDETDRSKEETENMYEFFSRMVSGS